MGKILFVTGTDTGVGKTVLTLLLLAHWRSKGVEALAMKPFCCGSRGDAEAIAGFQGNRLSIDEINPYFFSAPVAPYVAAKAMGRRIRLDTVLERIHRLADQCEVLLVEGAGGLLVPLSKDFTVADIIAKLGCGVVLVSRNQLGTINHTLLSVNHLSEIGIMNFKVALMNSKEPDESAFTNFNVLNEFIDKQRLESVPFLGRFPARSKVLEARAKKLKKVLAAIGQVAIFCAR